GRREGEWRGGEIRLPGEQTEQRSSFGAVTFPGLTKLGFSSRGPGGHDVGDLGSQGVTAGDSAQHAGHGVSFAPSLGYCVGAVAVVVAPGGEQVVYGVADVPLGLRHDAATSS